MSEVELPGPEPEPVRKVVVHRTRWVDPDQIAALFCFALAVALVWFVMVVVNGA